VGAVRGIAWYCGLLILLACALARANDIDVREARLRVVEEGLVLDADFAFDLTPRLAEVLANGVPLYFRVDFELTRRRWYWLDERAAERQLHLRLSYHALSRHYRVSTGLLQRSFASLDEALDVLKHVRGWLVVERTVSFADADYEAATRMRLDTALLPKPFQLSALTSRELHLESAWRRFTVRSPQQLPAPVETREPRAAAP
jgi:Domain of unknown function (DUF4390)